MTSLLKIDPRLEQHWRDSLTWWERAAKWTHQYIPFRIYYELPYGRVSLETQLKLRNEFAATAWVAAGFEPSEVLPLLRAIGTELRLPNAFLLPCDPFSVVFIPDYDDFPAIWLAHSLKQLGVKYDPTEIARFASREDATVADFIHDALHRMSSTH